jgi:hypothetical protein
MRTRTRPRKRVRDPGFERLGDARAGGLNGRRDALTAGGGDSLSVEDGQGHGVAKKPRNPPTFAVEQAAEVGATTIVSVGQ